MSSLIITVILYLGSAVEAAFVIFKLLNCNSNFTLLYFIIAFIAAVIINCVIIEKIFNKED